MLFFPLCQRLHAEYQEVVEQVFALALAKLLCLFACSIKNINNTLLSSLSGVGS